MAPLWSMRASSRSIAELIGPDPPPLPLTLHLSHLLLIYLAALPCSLLCVVSGWALVLVAVIAGWCLLGLEALVGEVGGVFGGSGKSHCASAYQIPLAFFPTLSSLEWSLTSQRIIIPCPSSPAASSPNRSISPLPFWRTIEPDWHCGQAQRTARCCSWIGDEGGRRMSGCRILASLRTWTRLYLVAR